VTSLLLVSKKV